MVSLSLILPIHNAVSTICRCLDSIITQYRSDFEVILVDDGSTDGSAKICAEYCNVDPRFMLLYQDNHGVSSARNHGLLEARGEVISFVDADDYLSPTYTNRLLAEFEQRDADVVFFGYYRVMNNGCYVERHIPTLDKAGFLPSMLKLSADNMFGYTWIKAYRRSAIGHVRYQEDISLFEDEVFTCQVLKDSRRISAIPEPLYYYVVSETGSLSSEPRSDYCFFRDKIFHAWQDMLSDEQNKEKVLTAVAEGCLQASTFYWKKHDLNEQVFFRCLQNSSFVRYLILNHSRLEKDFPREVRSMFERE